MIKKIERGGKWYRRGEVISATVIGAAESLARFDPPVPDLGTPTPGHCSRSVAGAS